MAHATGSRRTSGERMALTSARRFKQARETYVDHVSSQTGIDARHEATHAVIGRLLRLCFRESTIDRSRVCGLTKTIYRKTPFLPSSVFSLFWDLFPGVTDIEFPALGPTVMRDPDRRRHLDDWLTTVLAGYELERQMGLHAGLGQGTQGGYRLLGWRCGSRQSVRGEAVAQSAGHVERESRDPGRRQRGGSPSREKDPNYGRG